jgi:hypothetical protein
MTSLVEEYKKFLSQKINYTEKKSIKIGECELFIQRHPGLRDIFLKIKFLNRFMIVTDVIDVNCYAGYDLIIDKKNINKVVSGIVKLKKYGPRHSYEICINNLK